MMGRSVGLPLTRYMWIIDCGCCDFLSPTSLWFRFCVWIFIFVFHHNFNSSFISFTPMSGLPHLLSMSIMVTASRCYLMVPVTSVMFLVVACVRFASLASLCPLHPCLTYRPNVLSYQLAAIGAFHLPQAI